MIIIVVITIIIILTTSVVIRSSVSLQAAGLLGTGTSGGQKSETSKQAPTRKTKAAAVDRRQNNRMLRQCPSGIAQRPPHYAIAVPTAVQNRQSHSHVRSSADGKQLKQEKSNSLSL